MGLVDDIKKQAKKSGTNKGKFLYFKAGSKIRVRFLDDMDDGHKVTFHDSFANNINVPCQETFGRECEHCENDELRTRDQYAWSVWDYEAKEVKLLLAAVNQCSPVPTLVSMYEAYGTLTDRDYVITKSGQQQSTTFAIVPMDKVKFRNEKAKAYSESKFLTLLDKAFPDGDNTDDDDDDDEEEVKPKRGAKPVKPTVKPKKKKPEPEPEEDEWEEEDDDAVDYTEMSPLELFKLCKERDIEAKPKKVAKYYIGLLEADDDNDEEDEEEDEWAE